MKVSGRIEVFTNKNGYLTGYLKNFVDNKPNGKAFIDVHTSKEFRESLDKTKTYTLNVKEGFLNVDCIKLENKNIYKLTMAIVEADIVSVFPEDVVTVLPVEDVK